MSTSFAIWPSERFEVRSMAESTFLLPLLNSEISPCWIYCKML